MKKINILIISYKQQDLITRALDSILCQKEFGLNHIIVSDDCSPDKTWSVLQEYKDKYPEIIQIYQNEKNLGIYGNLNKMIDRKGDADVYYIMAGDDALCEGILEQVQKTIQNNSIDCTESVAMYYDWKLVKPDGTESIYSNKAVLSSKDAFGLKLRNRYSGRSCFVTYGLMMDYKKVDTSLGISLAESLADLQYSRLAKYNYYESHVGSIYYSGIGVSTTLLCKDYYEKSTDACVKLCDILKLKGRDYYWMEYRLYFYKLAIRPSLIYFIKALFYYSLGAKYGPIKKVLIELYELYRVLFAR